jgi:hypothetical protein
MVERQPPKPWVAEVADSISAGACCKANVVAQKKRFFDLVVTVSVCDECRWNYIADNDEVAGFESWPLPPISLMGA